MFHFESQVKSGITNVQKQINYANNRHLGTVLCFCIRVPGHPKFQPASFVHGAQTQFGRQRREASCKRKIFGNCTRKSSFCALVFSGHIFCMQSFLNWGPAVLEVRSSSVLLSSIESKNPHKWNLKHLQRLFLWSWPKPTQPGNPTAICRKNNTLVIA